MSHQVYSAPSSLKKLRACLSCHLIKTEEQFLKEGCENCKNFFNKNEITQHFKGMIAITNPRYSWCAKWLKKRIIYIYLISLI